MKYKRRWKCFSLVELIVVLTIMAIVAAMCAPGIAAYVRTAKVQNYQTALNNLVDEVQTQLPQSRYWNWEEVQENAEAILRSDAGRGVSDVSTPSDIAANKRIYQVTNASTDANVVYYLTLAYTPVTSGTKQNIQITASCDGYTSVTADQSCEVLLKSNYTDAENYPMIAQTVTTTDRSGWKKMLDDRVKTYSGADGWGEAFGRGEFPDNNFGTEVAYADAVHINTTDYPANSVHDIKFKMDRYFRTGPGNGTIGGVWTPDGNVYQYLSVYPVVHVQNGIGTGAQYAACGTAGTTFQERFQNVEILVGDQEDDDTNWVKYTDVFSENYYAWDLSTPGLTTEQREAVQKYQAYYHDPYTHHDGYLQNQWNSSYSDSDNFVIKYRVHLSNPLDTELHNSRGWISVLGMVQGHSGGATIEPTYHMETQPDGTVKKIYDDIEINVQIPDYVDDLNTLIEDPASWPDASGAKYFDTNGLTYTGYIEQYGRQIEQYLDSGGNRVQYDIGTVSMFYQNTDNPIRKDDVGYYYISQETAEMPNSVQWNPGWYQWKLDEIGHYLEANEVERVYVPEFHSQRASYTVITHIDENGACYFSYQNEETYQQDVIYLDPGKSFPENTYLNLIADEQGMFYYEYSQLKRFYLDENALPTEYFPVFLEDEKYVYHYEKRNDLNAEETALADENLHRVKAYHNGEFYIDLANSGYSAGDIIKLSFKNIDVDKFADYAENYGGAGFYTMYTKKQFEDRTGHLANGKFYQSASIDSDGKIVKNGEGLTIRDYANQTVSLFIVMDWDVYPQLKFNFQGVYADFLTDVDVSATWESKNIITTDRTVTTSVPMLTINGNDNYANVTLDWSQCDESVIQTYANELKVQFSSSVNYTLYDKDYKQISFTPISTFALGSIYSYANYADLIHGGRIHFYCDGVSANTIQVDINMSQRLKDALNAITITTTPPIAIPVTPPASTTTVPVVTTAAATVTTTVTTTTITTVTTSATNAAATSTTANSAEASTTETTAATTTVTSAYDIVLAPEMEDRCELVAVNGPLDEQMRFMIEICPKDGWQFADPVQLYVNGQTASSTGESTRWIIWYNEAYAPYVITVDGIVPVQTTETTDVTTVTTTVTTTAATTTTTTTTELTTTDTTTTTIVTTTTTTTLLEEEKMVKIHVLAGDTDVCKVVQIQNNTYSTNEWYSTSSTDNKDFTVVLKSGEYFHIWTKSDWNGTNIDTGYHPKADNLCDWCSPGSHITYDSLTVDELWIYNGKVYEEDPVTILPESLQRTENIASLIAAFRKPTANPVTTTSTTATAATTAVTITTTTTTTAVTSAGIAAHEDGMAVGLDAESAKVCNITFEKSLFNESGMCYFTITPKDGYVLPDNYTVKVGTVTLTSQNYKATTNQWYFWKSSGMNEYTIHVEGVIAE